MYFMSDEIMELQNEEDLSGGLQFKLQQFEGPLDLLLHLIKEAKMAGKGIVSNVDVFDIYEGENVTNDCKSVALKIIYNAKDHTLKDQEVIEAETKIKESLQKKFHALLRG